MEEIVQRVLRLAPPWAREILTISALSGAAIAALHSMFAPTIDKHLEGIIDPTTVTLTNAAFASLVIIAPIWGCVRWLNPNRKPTHQVLHNVDLIESVMERVDLQPGERITVRRNIVKALQDQIKRTSIKSIKPEIVLDVAEEGVPGLIRSGQAKTTDR